MKVVASLLALLFAYACHSDTVDPLSPGGFEDASRGSVGTTIVAAHESRLTTVNREAATASLEEEARVRAMLDREPRQARLVTRTGERRAVIDLGCVSEGETPRRVFELVSAGTRSVAIDRVRTTCGCTNVELRRVNPDGSETPYALGEPLEPETRLNVHTELETRGLRGEKTPRILVHGDDPDGPVVLELRAEIVPFFEVETLALSFGQIVVGNSRTRSLEIAAVDRQALLLEIVPESLSKDFSAMLTPVEPDAGGRAARWLLDVTAGPAQSSGQTHCGLQLRSNVEIPGAALLEDGRPPNFSLEISCAAQFVDPVESDTFMLGILVKPGTEIDRRLRITSHDPELRARDLTFRIVGDIDVWGNPEPWSYPFELVVTPQVDEGRNSVDLEVRGRIPDGFQRSFRGNLLVEARGSAEVLEFVPIHGAVR